MLGILSVDLCLLVAKWSAILLVIVMANLSVVVWANPLVLV
jgi:hypothetical protein